MSDELGPITFGKKEEQIFLGREISQHRDYSEATAIKIDGAVRNLVVSSHKKVTELLTQNLDSLKNLAEALLEKETLAQNDIEEILKAEAA